MKSAYWSPAVDIASDVNTDSRVLTRAARTSDNPMVLRAIAQNPSAGPSALASVVAQSLASKDTETCRLALTHPRCPGDASATVLSVPSSAVLRAAALARRNCPERYLAEAVRNATGAEFWAAAGNPSTPDVRVSSAVEKHLKELDGAVLRSDVSRARRATARLASACAISERQASDIIRDLIASGRLNADRGVIAIPERRPQPAQFVRAEIADDPAQHTAIMRALIGVGGMPYYHYRKGGGKTRAATFVAKRLKVDARHAFDLIESWIEAGWLQVNLVEHANTGKYRRGLFAGPLLDLA